MIVMNCVEMIRIERRDFVENEIYAIYLA